MSALIALILALITMYPTGTRVPGGTEYAIPSGVLYVSDSYVCPAEDDPTWLWQHCGNRHR